MLRWCFLVGLQETSSDLDKQAEKAYNLLMAVRSPTPQAAAADSTVDQQQKQLEQFEPEEQLFAVYLPPVAGAARGSSLQFVQLLRLPVQAWEHNCALQRGMLIVPLQAGSGQHDDSSHAVSAEELAWQEQQGHICELAQQQQDIFFGWTPLGMDVGTVSSSIDSSNGIGGEGSSISSADSGGVSTSSAQSSDSSAAKSSSSIDSASISASSRIKVRRGAAASCLLLRRLRKARTADVV